MNLNSNLKSLDSLPVRYSHYIQDPQTPRCQNLNQIEFHSNEHSRKTSQGSLKSLPLTSTSMSLHSDTKRAENRKRLREILQESKNDIKIYQQSIEKEANGDDPFELITQPEIPKLLWCAYCKGERRTSVIYTNNSATFYNSVAIFLMGGFFGCCLLPYASNCCKDQKTICSKCNHFISETEV